MAVSPDDLLDAAVALGTGQDEAAWRNATSRAYYAAYHSCRAVARDVRLDLPDTGSVHAALCDALTAPFSSRQLKQLGYLLGQCRRRRTDADYRIEQDFPQDVADTTVDDCREILRRADSIIR